MSFKSSNSWERKEKLYIAAFLELFQSQYAPHVGDVERLAGKKTRRLFVTLPNNYEWLINCYTRKYLKFYYENGEIFHIEKTERKICRIV